MYTRDVQYPVADSEFDGKGGGAKSRESGAALRPPEGLRQSPGGDKGGKALGSSYV